MKHAVKIGLVSEKPVYEVWNRTRSSWLAGRVRVADTPRERRVGLLGKKGLRPGEGLLIVPTQAIHTFFMKISIDVVFLDRQRRVRRVYHRLAPNRITRFVWAAHSVLELEPGQAEKCGLAVGDELEIRRVSGDLQNG